MTVLNVEDWDTGKSLTDRLSTWSLHVCHHTFKHPALHMAVQISSAHNSKIVQSCASTHRLALWLCIVATVL